MNATKSYRACATIGVRRFPCSRNQAPRYPPATNASKAYVGVRKWARPKIALVIARAAMSDNTRPSPACNKPRKSSSSATPARMAIPASSAVDRGASRGPSCSCTRLTSSRTAPTRVRSAHRRPSSSGIDARTPRRACDQTSWSAPAGLMWNQRPRAQARTRRAASPATAKPRKLDALTSGVMWRKRVTWRARGRRRLWDSPVPVLPR